MRGRTSSRVDSIPGSNVFLIEIWDGETGRYTRNCTYNFFAHEVITKGRKRIVR